MGQRKYVTGNKKIAWVRQKLKHNIPKLIGCSKIISDREVSRYKCTHQENWEILIKQLDYPDGSEVKNLPVNTGKTGSIPGSGRSPWRRKSQPTPVFLLGKSHGQRNLAGYCPWDPKESDTIWLLNNSNNFKQLTLHLKQLEEGK